MSSLKGRKDINPPRDATWLHCREDIHVSRPEGEARSRRGAGLQGRPCPSMPGLPSAPHLGSEAISLWPQSLQIEVHKFGESVILEESGLQSFE